MGTHPIFESDFDCLTELDFRTGNFGMDSENALMDDGLDLADDLGETVCETVDVSPAFKVLDYLEENSDITPFKIQRLRAKYSQKNSKISAVHLQRINIPRKETQKLVVCEISY